MITLEPRIRTVVWDYEMTGSDGQNYPCTISYEIDERTKIVHAYGLSFHYGYNSDHGLTYIPEILREIIEALEGTNQLSFECAPIIE